MVSRPPGTPWLQVKPTPPLPALRLVVICNLIGEAAMVAFHLVPLLARRLWQRRQQAMRAEPRSLLPLHGSSGQAADKADSSASSSSGLSVGASRHLEGREQREGGAGDAASAHAAADVRSRPGNEPAEAAQAAAEPAAASNASTATLRPPVPLMRGMTLRMERWRRRRPVLHRRLALSAIVLTFTGCCSLQILAPGFVDVSIGAPHAPFARELVLPAAACRRALRPCSQPSHHARGNGFSRLRSSALLKCVVSVPVFATLALRPRWRRAAQPAPPAQ